MDIESGLELGKIPLTAGEVSLPFPESETKHRKNPEDDDYYLVPIPPWTAREIVITALATATVVMSIIIVLLPFLNPLVLITGILGIIVPPYSALQEQKLTDCKAIQETNERMGHELKNLQYENDRLTEENDKVESAVEKIQKTKDTLTQIQRTNVKSVVELEKQLKESQKVLDQSKVNYRAELVDNIFEVMIALDKDQDFKLSDDEIDAITKKLEGLQGIEIHDELFKQKIIESGRDLDSVLKLLHDLLDDDPTTAPEKQKIITFLPTSKN